MVNSYENLTIPSHSCGVQYSQSLFLRLDTEHQYPIMPLVEILTENAGVRTRAEDRQYALPRLVVQAEQFGL